MNNYLTIRIQGKQATVLLQTILERMLCSATGVWAALSWESSVTKTKLLQNYSHITRFLSFKPKLFTCIQVREITESMP